MAQWKALSVKNAITKIKDGEMVLPVIQRRLVWDEDKMTLLFDTLLKGNSFGSIICIEEEKDTKPLFAYREFTRDGNPVESKEVSELSKTQWFIIDGQQRLQSFYIGLTGTLNGKRLYFDLFSNCEEMEYEFRFTDNEGKLPTINKERKIDKCHWCSVDYLFTKLTQTSDDEQVSDEIIKKHSINDPVKTKTIEKNIRRFNSAIFSNESIGISIVPVNKSKEETENRQRIVELFRRLNVGATILSSYDLVASMFKGFNYKMEAFLDIAVSENKDIGIDQDTLIKLIMVLNDKPTKVIADLTAEDAEFATSKRVRIRNTLKSLKKFLHASKNYEWFCKNNRSGIPLYFLSYHIFYSTTKDEELENMFNKFDTNDQSFRNMAIWLRLSLLNKVFSYGCGWRPNTTGIKKIHEVMKQNKGKTFPKDSLFKVYTYHPLYFTYIVDKERVCTLDPEYILYLIYDGQPQIRKEDVDHIHPHSLLQGRFDEWKINNIVNYQLLDSGTNRGDKNGKELSVWIKSIELKDQQKIYLSRHIIPQDKNLWKTENFEQFFEVRSQMLSDKINRLL